VAVIVLPVIFRGPTQGDARIEVTASTIAASLEAAESRYPGLSELIVDPETGAIHRFVKVALNGEGLAHDPEVLETAVNAQDEIEVLAAVAGG